MSSVESLREFVIERLTAAAEEIFKVFNDTVIEYEEEIDCQRKLLDIAWKPVVKLHRIELPQQHVCKEEEVLADQQLCNQERNSSLDQEEPEPPQIKEEEEDELCTSQEGEQLELKQETDISVLILPYENGDDSEDQASYFNPDETQSAAEKESAVNTRVKSPVESNSDPQPLSNDCHVAESQDQTGDERGDSGSTRNAKSKQNNQQGKSKRNVNNVNNLIMSKVDRKNCTGKKSFKCDTCGKSFIRQSQFDAHMRIHTGEKPYLCKTCGKGFRVPSLLKYHMRIHTGEKPFICKTCEKGFVTNYELIVHMRRHTGERPYHCITCGRDFFRRDDLKTHVQISHTDERPFNCKTCGKCLTSKRGLKKHMRIHTGEKPFSCTTCGKDFVRRDAMLAHTRIHTGEKSFSCKECGREFISRTALSVHKKRAHSDQETVQS